MHQANDIAAIFRGHQHDTPWLLQLNDHSGFVDPWKDGLVTSIISFATLYDSIVENFYTEMKKKRANFPPYRPTPAAFALAKLVEDPAQWQITHCIANAGADVAEKPCHLMRDWRAGTGLESVDAKRVAAFTQFRQPAPTANGAVDFDTSAQPPSLLQQQPLLLQQLNEALVGAPEKGREPPDRSITHNENGMPKLIDPSSLHAGTRDSVRRNSGGGGMEPHSAKADATTTLGDLASGLCAFPENSARKVPAPPSAACEVVAFAENAFKSDQNPAIFYTCVARANPEPRRAPHPTRYPRVLPPLFLRARAGGPRAAVRSGAISRSCACLRPLPICRNPRRRSFCAGSSRPPPSLAARRATARRLPQLRPPTRAPPL